MLYKTISAAVYGIDANLIEVEVDIALQVEKDAFMTVGLPDAAVRESRERVRSALKNSGYDIPPSNTTINLAPADLRKEGSGFDLPMALGILGAYGGLHNQATGRCAVCWRTLARRRSSRSSWALCRSPSPRAPTRSSKLILPEVNAREAAVVEGVTCIRCARSWTW